MAVYHADRQRRKGGTGTSLAGQDIVWCILCDFYRRNICVFHSALTAIIGYGGLLAIILFALAAFGIGYLLGGYAPHMRAVLAFGAAQRGLSVALVFPLLRPSCI